jgi:hypothetical protein
MIHEKERKGRNRKWKEGKKTKAKQIRSGKPQRKKRIKKN